MMLLLRDEYANRAKDLDKDLDSLYSTLSQHQDHSAYAQLNKELSEHLEQFNQQILIKKDKKCKGIEQLSRKAKPLTGILLNLIVRTFNQIALGDLKIRIPTSLIHHQFHLFLPLLLILLGLTNPRKIKGTLKVVVHMKNHLKNVLLILDVMVTPLITWWQVTLWVTVFFPFILAPRSQCCKLITISTD